MEGVIRAKAHCSVSIFSRAEARGKLASRVNLCALPRASINTSLAHLNLCRICPELQLGEMQKTMPGFSP